MSKMGLHDSFGYLKHKLWPKEGSIIELPFKFRNRPNFLTCRWRATYCWKALDEGYNFFLKFTSIKCFHTKLWATKVAIVPILGILGLPIWSPETK